MSSLSARLLLAVSLLLLVFFGATIFVLDTAFRNAAERAVQERLDVQIIVLLSAAELDDDDRLRLPEALPEARFVTPGSGLYGQVTDEEGRLVWRSPSSVGVFVPVPTDVAPAERRFNRLTASDGTPVVALSMGVAWQRSDDSSVRFTFSVAESLEALQDQIGKFRRQLFGWFGALMALLLAGQGLLLRWVLGPLRRLEREVDDIEAGKRNRLGGGYPTELRRLTENANRLIGAEIKRLSRYRDTLGNLAHSLKTPLAVIRNALEERQDDARRVATVQEQVDRMNDIVGYQLQRAAAAGGLTLGHRPVSIADVTRKVTASMDKVYADKGIACTTDVAGDALFHGDEGDLIEVAGNLIDNAYKYGRATVRVHTRKADRDDRRRAGVLFVIEDDGPGISDADARDVLGRGVRVDEQVDGHGIGLAVVREIVDLYEGEVRIDRSPLGGARVTVRLP